MEWHLSIPKILHLYWGGGNLYYLRYMTIKTFMNHNPDWTIIFWYPKHPSTNITWNSQEQRRVTNRYKDFFTEIMELPLITKVAIDFQDYGLDNNMSEVHKSDFLRLQQLSTLGGMWSDMDIFYIKSMNNLYINAIENKNIETIYCSRANYGHSIGFLMASQRNKFFEKIKEIAKKEFNPLDYQSVGVNLYNKYFSTFESINAITPSINISMDVVYPYDANQIGQLKSVSETKYPPKMKFTDKTIGVHWYGGSTEWKGFMSKTNGGLDNLPNNIIGNLLKNENRRIKDIVH